eukprot:XP_024437815.1 probable alpha-mannosidase At5g13980 isoform X3 [Populus trichocarpa]
MDVFLFLLILIYNSYRFNHHFAGWRDLDKHSCGNFFLGWIPRVLPDNVAITSLQELDDGTVLLRLAHLYEIGEDKDLSVMASVELIKVLKAKKMKKINRNKLIRQSRKS